MKIVYIAGPFRAESAWDIEQNVRRAERVALAVWKMGAAALCPHTMGRFFQGALEDEVWEAGYLAMLRKCDAVLTLDGWQTSGGSIVEVKVANDLGIPVFRSLSALEATLRVWATQ